MRDAIAVCQSMPGPLAIQVGIFAAYLRAGFWGAWAGGWSFILPNFLIVAILAALYVNFGGLPWMTGVFYGVSPAVIALIIHATWRLARLSMRDRVQWAITAAAFAITVGLQAEVALVFIGAGLAGVAWYGTLFRNGAPTALAVATPALPLLGYLVAGFWGSLAATAGIFLPSFILVLIAAPLLIRHRGNPNVKGFVQGAYAAAIGTIAGACILLGKIAIGDWLTAVVAILAVFMLFRWKVSNLLLMMATAAIGLIAYPILQPPWVFVK